MFLTFIYDVNAAEFSTRAIVTTGTEYDSNPSLAENNKNPVWVYTITPQLQLDATSELSHWYLNSALLVQRFSNDKVLADRQDPKFIAGWIRTYESGTYGLKANYQEATSRNLELTSTGVFADKNGTQRTKSVEGMWEHSINERLSILNEAFYNIYKFDNAGGLASYDVSELRSTLTYLNTEKLNTYSQLGYLHYSPDSVMESTEFVRFALGADYQLNERFNFGVRGGVYQVSGRQSESGWEAGLKAKYDPNDKTSYIAELARSLGAGGIGGFQKADSLKASWNYNLSDKNIMGVDYGLNKSHQDSQINIVAVDYQQFGIFYERILSNHWQARLSGSHKEVNTRDVNAQSNVIGVAFTYDTLGFN